MKKYTNLILILLLLCVVALLSMSCASSAPLSDEEKQFRKLMDDIEKSSSNGEDRHTKKIVSINFDKSPQYREIFDMQDEDGITPLMLASKQGNHVLVKKFLTSAVFSDTVNTSGKTALLISLSQENDEIVFTLLDEGANPNIPDINGTTPLFQAAKQGRFTAMKILIKYGALPDTPVGEREMTPFMIAARNGDTDMLSFLHLHHANINAKTQDGYTALDFALENKQWENASFLIEQYDMKINMDEDSPSSYLFFRSVENDDIDTTRQLLKYGVNPNISASNGSTPLMGAVHYNNLEIVQLLLDHGADVNAVNINGYTPLALALENSFEFNGTEYISEALIDAGADLNPSDESADTNNENNTPAILPMKVFLLSYLSLMSYYIESHAQGDGDNITKDDLRDISYDFFNEQIDYLYEKGARFEKTQLGSIVSEYNEIMNFALQEEFFNVFDRLLNYEAPTGTRMANDELQFLYASATGDKSMVTRLASRMNRTQLEKAFRLASYREQIEVMDYLIDKNIDINSFEDRSKDGETARDPRGQSALSYACREGKLASVKYLVEHGAELNTSRYGITPFMSAILHGHIDIAEYLLTQDVVLESSNRYPPSNEEIKGSALRIAARDGYFDLVRKLVEAGANIDEKNEYGINALQMASISGNPDIVVYLIEKGADIHATNNEGQDILFYAIDRELPNDVVRLILEKDVSPDSRSNDQLSALRDAIWSGSNEEIKLLIEYGANVNDNLYRRDENEDPFYSYINNMNLLGEILFESQVLPEIMQLFLDKGADAYYISPAEFNLFDYALLFYNITDDETEKKNIIDKTNILIEYDRRQRKSLLQDSSIYISDMFISSEFFALLYNSYDLDAIYGMNKVFLEAVREEKFNIVEMLLTNNAISNVNFRESKTTPLHVAIFNKDTKMIELLFDHGADVDYSNASDTPPISIAIKYHHKEIVSLLLNKGADLQVHDDDGWYPLAYAIYFDDNEIFSILLEAGADISKAIGNLSALQGIANYSSVQEDILVTLLEHGTEVNQVDEHGYSPLYYAIRNRRNDIATILLEHGASPDLRESKDVWTPLIVAIKRNNYEMVEKLLDAGADVEEGNDAGWVPMMYAARYNKPEILQLLIDRGAKIDIANKHYWTVLAQACVKDNKEVVKILLDNGAKVDFYITEDRSPLVIAKMSGHHEVEKMLIAAQKN